jgi:hypothetical protein
MLSISDLLLASRKNSKDNREKIARFILENPSLLPELMGCLNHSEQSFHAEAADILKKIGKQSPELLLPHQSMLLDILLEASIHQVQWHLCQTLVVLDINDVEFDKLYPKLLEFYVSSDSRVVKASALTAFVELSLKLNTHTEKSRELIRDALKSKLPAVSARARHLNSYFTDCVRPTWWKS